MSKKITAIKLRVFWVIICLLSIPIIIYAEIIKSQIILWLGLSMLVITAFLAAIAPPQVSFEGLVADYRAMPFNSIANLGIDNWNWNVILSEIKDINIVKLKNKEERKKVTRSRFLFKKYMKITMKSGKEKYLYISLFSNKQINELIKLLSSKK